MGLTLDPVTLLTASFIAPNTLSSSSLWWSGTVLAVERPRSRLAADTTMDSASLFLLIIELTRVALNFSIKRTTDSLGGSCLGGWFG